VACCLLISCKSANAQKADNVDLVKKENELLKKENDLLKKEIEGLKKEIEQLKKPTGKLTKESTEKPSASVDGVDFVVDKITRNGGKVTLEILATSSKGTRSVWDPKLEAVDLDGKVSKTGGFPRGKQINLREGAATRIEVAVNEVDSKATEFKQMDLRLGGIKDTITFKNVSFGK
jgi:cell division septum initiation protein DivIVA